MPTVGIFTPRTWLKMMFQAWAWMMARVCVEGYATEVGRLNKLLGKRSSSIWTMNKSELVETARKELGMTMIQAEKESVTALRERIRSARAVTSMVTDPLAKLPKGLEKLTLAELKEEALVRDLPEPDPATRAKLIVLIRDDVASRLILERPSSSTTDRRANTSSEKTVGQEEDWEMPEENSRNTRRR